MSQEEYTEFELRALIASFREGLNLLLDTTSSKVIQIKSSEVEDPEIEIQKLGKLVFAHSTKIGIAFRPLVSITAAFKQLKEESQLFALFLSLIRQLSLEKFGKIYQDEIIELIKELISVHIALLNELENLDFNEKSTGVKKDEVDGRLVSIGKIWEICKKLDLLIKDGKLGLLKKNISQSIEIIEDSLEEFTEWLENPTVYDENDPFGMNAENDDDETESENEDDDKDPFDPQVLEFANKWVDKIKMLKLLLSSLIKSLPTDNKSVSGEEIDNFNNEQLKLIEQNDDIVAGFFVNTSLYETKSNISQIKRQSELLIELVKELNKGDAKKTNWLSIWQEKFIQ